MIPFAPDYIALINVYIGLALALGTSKYKVHVD